MTSVYEIAVLSVALIILALILSTGHQQRGFVLTTWTTDGYCSAATGTTVSKMKSVGANSVEILITAYQSSAFSPDIAYTTKTPTKAALNCALDRVAGMNIVLKPHVDMMDESWRGNIRMSTETDWDLWFENYEKYLVEYMDVAWTRNVKTLAIGTELKNTESQTARWTKLIENMRSRYSGIKLYYIANWDTYDKVQFWDELDYVGISGYFPLTNDNWSGIVTKLRALDKPIILGEVGYQDKLGAFDTPWYTSGAISTTEQTQAYTDLMANSNFFRGIYIWQAHYDGTDPDRFGIFGKPAEEVVRRKWKG